MNAIPLPQLARLVAVGAPRRRWRGWSPSPGGRGSSLSLARARLVPSLGRGVRRRSGGHRCGNRAAVTGPLARPQPGHSRSRRWLIHAAATIPLARASPVPSQAGNTRGPLAPAPFVHSHPRQRGWSTHAAVNARLAHLPTDNLAHPPKGISRSHPEASRAAPIGTSRPCRWASRTPAAAPSRRSALGHSRSVRARSRWSARTGVPPAGRKASRRTQALQPGSSPPARLKTSAGLKAAGRAAAAARPPSPAARRR